MATTPGGLPYPIGTDFVVDGDDAIRALAEKLDEILLRAWTPYVPVLGGITIGNGGLAGRVSKIGRNVRASVFMTFGSTTVLTGSISVGLPTALGGSFVDQVMPTGIAQSLIAGTFTELVVAPASPTTVTLRTTAGSTAGPGIPGAWGPGSTLAVSLAYESAT